MEWGQRLGSGRAASLADEPRGPSWHSRLLLARASSQEVFSRYLMTSVQHCGSGSSFLFLVADFASALAAPSFAFGALPSPAEPAPFS